MIPKADLHQLIHSLEKSEKRYFTLFAQRHVIGKENKYLLLYNILEKQKQYNERRLKTALGERGIYTNLSAEKAYLKELILKSLKHFHEKNFIDSILYDKLIQIEILYEKGLFKMGYELILKALELSGKHEKYLINTQLLIWKINYDIKLNYFDSGAADSAKSSQNLSLFLESLNYKKKFHELFYLTNHSDKLKKKKEIQQVIREFKPEKQNALPQSDLGLYYYYASLSFIAVLENNSDKASVYFGKGLSVFKRNPLFCKENANLYLVSANNYIFSLIINNDLKLAENEITTLEQTTETLDLTVQQKARVSINILDNRLLILAKENKWKTAREIALQAEKDLRHYEKYIDTPRKIYIYFSFANVHFFAGDYRLANKFLNKITNPKAIPETEPYLLALAYIAQLVIMVEAKDMLLLRNRLTTTRKYLKQHAISGALPLICDLVSLYYKDDRKTRTQERELKDQILAEYKTNNALKELFGYFDMIKWMENS
ncbi:MAG: hypothetical protein ACXVPN_03390 [Bacteroidia bacterium]